MLTVPTRLFVANVERVLVVAAIPVGIVVVRGDCDLETCRLYIDRLQEASPRFLLLLLLFLLLLFPPLFCSFLAVTFSWHPQRRPSALFIDVRASGKAAGVMWETFCNTNICEVLTQTLRLCVNLQTCVCLPGLAPGAIYWPQSALPGI